MLREKGRKPKVKCNTGRILLLIQMMGLCIVLLIPHGYFSEEIALPRGTKYLFKTGSCQRNSRIIIECEDISEQASTWQK